MLHYGMTVLDHNGPKGQVFLTNRQQPLWFTSVCDTIAFTRLPEQWTTLWFKLFYTGRPIMRVAAMIRRIFTVSIVAFCGAVLADETISVYQLDGSIHCQAVEVTTPAQAADILEQAGVKVISSDSRSVPFSISSVCGTPTGKANVLVVDDGDWKKMLRKRTDAHGFGVWVFDRSAVEVYKYDGSLQCDRGKGTSLQDMARELTDKGIEVKASRKGSDGRMHITMCGASTGRLNVYTIANESLPGARELGFELLVTRKMTNEIGVSRAGRRAPALSRTPPRDPQAAAGRGMIPKLW